MQWMRGFWVAVFTLVLFQGCGGRWSEAPPEDRGLLPSMGYAIQVGAFSSFENAVRLSESLQKQGVWATFFRDADGLYKVRCGNFRDRESALMQARRFQDQGIIDVFYIVSPDQYAGTRRRQLGEAYVRDQLVMTARRFIDLPYRWGGTSVETGFDCSGLAMTVYQLNGLALPRTSSDQFKAGVPVPPHRVREGDLLFFANGFGRSVSHVGIYIGSGRFIHAPGEGKTIRVADLSANYHRKRFVGARSYL